MRKKRLVLVDDEPTILLTFSKILKDKGYEVITYNSPKICSIHEENSNGCPNDHPCADIIITDYFLPQMTGFSLYKLQSQKGCKIHIKNKAIMSGYPNFQYSDEENDIAYPFFVKPFSINDLTEWLIKCDENIDISKPLSALI